MVSGANPRLLSLPCKCTSGIVEHHVMVQNRLHHLQAWTVSMCGLDALLPWLTILFGISCLILFTLPSQYGKLIGRNRSANRVQILVLGDIGRSPRMQYHALSIAKHGASVDLVGYVDSDIHPRIIANPSFIRVHALKPTPRFLKTDNKALFLFYGPLKILFQCWTLWNVLGYKTKPARWMLVQNPPSIPTLLIATIICFVRHTRLVIDWHNFGYSILALRLSNGHPMVRISRVYEQVLAQFAFTHFCVTNAMARVLERDFLVAQQIRTLHDRPASGFQPLSKSQRSTFLERLPRLLCSDDMQKLQELQRLVDEVKIGKSRLLVSSTSWTPDEDFSILLDALTEYSDLAITSHPELPEILTIITGKGPQKIDFLKKIQSLKAAEKLEMVTIETAFFSADDYASLLGAADLGISLHTSSSGVDLPMKIVDMFGAGLPVAGWGNFEAWPELVQESVNGKTFRDTAGLQRVLMQLFGGDETSLKKLKEGAFEEGKNRWDDEWDRTAATLFFPRL